MEISKEELEQLYLKYKDKVLYFIRGKVSSQEDAEDLLSEVFIKVGRFYDKYDPEKSSVSTWIFSIARNTVIDHYRRQKDLSELPEDIPAEISLDDDLIEEEMLETLAEALEKMEPEYRDLVVLHYYKGRSLLEISGDMDISYGRIKLMHQKALVELKKAFKQS